MAARGIDLVAEKRRLDDLLTKYHITCNIPYVNVEHPAFIEFITAVNTSPIRYRPPCRKTVSNPLLRRLNGRVREAKRPYLQNTIGVLGIDGWRNTSPNEDYIVFSVRNVNIDQAFLSFRDFTTIPKTAHNIARATQEVIHEAEQDYDVQIVGAISDNAQNMINAMEEVHSPNGDPIVHVTCSSHSGNLLIQYFVDDLMLDTIREIVRAFKSPTLEKRLVQLGGTRLQNFPSTRFAYLRDTCVSIQRNYERLRILCLREDVEVPENVVLTILHDGEFLFWLQDTVNHLNPICRLINSCQDPKLSVADAVEQWLSLQLPTNRYDNIIRARIETAIQPAGFLANILHPMYHGVLLTPEQRGLAVDYLYIHFEDVVAEFDEYHERIGEFIDVMNDSEDPVSYWRFMQLRFPRLGRFAMGLMLIPASTAQLEGMFSSWKHHHTPCRNRLKTWRSGMEMEIYHSQRHAMLSNGQTLTI